MPRASEIPLARATLLPIPSLNLEIESDLHSCPTGRAANWLAARAMSAFLIAGLSSSGIAFESHHSGSSGLPARSFLDITKHYMFRRDDGMHDR